MKIKLRGISNLNSNDYDTIIVRELYDNILIQIDRAERKWSGEQTTFTFYDYLKEIDDNNKLKEVIKYFLENNKIISIMDKVNVKNHDKTFTVVSTISGKKLLLQLNNKEEYKQLRELILIKYNMDRLSFLNNCNSDTVKVEGSDNCSSYKIKENEIRLVVADKNKNDICFLKEFITEQLFKRDKKGTLLLNMLSLSHKKLKDAEYSEIFCDNYSVVSYSELLNEVLREINIQHNCDVNKEVNQKKKQLKLEGF